MEKEEVKLVINKKEKYIRVVYEKGNSYTKQCEDLENGLLLTIETLVNTCNKVITGICIESSVSGEDRRPTYFLN